MTETYRSKPLPPCKGCEARQLGCHASCEAYKAYRAAVDAFNRARRMQNDSFELLAKGVEKARKEQRRRPKNGRAEQ